MYPLPSRSQMTIGQEALATPPGGYQDYQPAEKHSSKQARSARRRRRKTDSSPQSSGSGSNNSPQSRNYSTRSKKDWKSRSVRRSKRPPKGKSYYRKGPSNSSRGAPQTAAPSVPRSSTRTKVWSNADKLSRRTPSRKAPSRRGKGYSRTSPRKKRGGRRSRSPSRGYSSPDSPGDNSNPPTDPSDPSGSDGSSEYLFSDSDGSNSLVSLGSLGSKSASRSPSISIDTNLDSDEQEEVGWRRTKLHKNNLNANLTVLSKKWMLDDTP